MKLSLPQQDVYFEQLMYPDDPIYNIGAKISIKGTIVFDALNEAYKMLINQHDSYRSILRETEEGPIMHILEKQDSDLEYVDFSAFDDAEEQADGFMQNTFQKPFKLQAGKLLHHFILVKVAEKHHYLFSVYHHIITDGWGTSLMFQRLVKNYNELIIAQKITTEYPYTYQDFVKDDQEYFLSEEYQKDKTYWTEKFKNLPEGIFEKLENSGKPNQSKRKEIFIKRAVYNQLTQVGKEAGGSTFHVILGILYLYFGRKHQNKDFAIGLPVLNRGKAIFKRTVGLFMGVSPLRIPLNFENSFEELVKTIRQELRKDYRHQRFPLGKLIKALDIFQDKERLFNITLSYEKQNYADHFADTETRVIPLSHHSERVALAIYIREFDESEDVKIDFDYNVNYFNENTISSVTAHFQRLLSEVIGDIKQPLSRYQYITEKEKETLLVDFNDTKYDYPEEATLIDFFKNQVNKNPYKFALVDEGKMYAYQDLDRISDRLASYLQKTSGDTSDEGQSAPVAVLMNRSADLVATFLGILKSGRAYIPLDPSFPKERLEYILDHSGVQQIIGTENLKNKFQFKQKFIAIELLLSDQESVPPIKIEKISSTTTAYIIYTSGSTGNPKGVVISHKALLNFLISMQRQPGIQQEDYFFSVTTPSFDISMLEFFVPLISGATAYIASQKLLSDPLAVVDQMKALAPTIIQATPSFYQMLYNAGWKGDQGLKILCGGDLLSETLAAKLLKTNLELWNMYGPTETTIWSGCKKINKATEASNIGKPIHNTGFYILDEGLQLLPIGSTGTLYIGGDGLAQGYYKNDQLTNEKFIANPFEPAKKIYDTGDLGKWNEEGEILFLGRNDLQVKIRGYRIELGEIETKLNQIEEIKSSVVIAQKKEHQDAVLIAYVISENEWFDSERAINLLRETLPGYMIPHVIIRLKEFPMTLNKKIDRKTLEARKIANEKELNSSEIPETELEIRLSHYFKGVLGIKEEIGLNDNFFRLGGHSLSAVKLINIINEQLHYKLTLKDIFDYPSVKTIVQSLGRKEVQRIITIPRIEKQPHYAITPAQYNIWLAALQEEKSIAYNMSAAFKIKGEIDKIVLEKIFLELFKKYEVLRSNFVEIAGIPKQKITPEEEVSLSIDEIISLDNELIETIGGYTNAAFDLENETLLKIALVHEKRKPSYLIFTTHHIILDGWSLEILIREVLDRYKALTKEAKKPDAELPFQFKDYAAWHLKEQECTAEKSLAFWGKYLNHYEWKQTIPFDNEFPSKQNTGATFDFVCSSVKLIELNKMAQEYKVSLHSLLVGAFKMLIYKLFGHEDICIGTLNSGRTLPALQDQLGMFVKTLPLRTHINPEWSFKELLLLTHKSILQIDAHQYIPEDVQKTLRLDMIVTVENPSLNYKHINLNEKVQLDLCPLNAVYSRLPLLIRMNAGEEYLSGAIDYNPGNFESATMELLSLKFEKLLTEIIKHPDKAMNLINIDLEIEKAKTIDISFDF